MLRTRVGRCRRYLGFNSDRGSPPLTLQSRLRHFSLDSETLVRTPTWSPRHLKVSTWRPLLGLEPPSQQVEA